ncbi:MAG: S1/P1 nuclease [Cyclobacteriaceae bacterium]
MKKVIFTLIAIFYLGLGGVSAFWGKTGHRVVGEVAEQYLSKRAKKNIKKVLGNESLAMASNYMDFIKSDPAYQHLNPWHYATIPDSLNYAQAGTPAEGDAIRAIELLKQELIKKEFSEGDELFTLRCLIHLVGDIHQPLHVGNGLDRGGNDVKVTYFGRSSNLHRVWDSQIIDAEQLSYTEYASSINFIEKKLVKKWQKDPLIEWANESKMLRSQVYQLPEDNKLSYRYIYDNIDIINQRLLQAGVRLAGILNEIYG